LALVSLVRNEEIMTEFEERSYQEGDTLTLFSTIENESVIKNWLQKEI
jgi:macrodomain Ter protein organizer (MatP/YcbG family)